MMIRSVTAQAVAAVVALGMGALAWTAAGRDAHTAGALRALVTLQGEAAARDLAAVEPPPRLLRWIPWVSSTAAGIGRARAAAAYWNDTGEVAAADDPLLAANHAYRAVMRQGGDAATLVARLDAIVKQYADVLRAEPASIEAAYNYEFVARYRSALATRRQAVAPATPDEGLTLHGRVGAPPTGTDTRSFKMIVPMRPDERRQAEEAGRSGKRTRKG